ncbi:hypothetical protein GO013_16395 [Pseudodesulfovibrio sp. JC047]|uniref:hypothetical protein n=1 Tax=Pseudodesulfovibrio sp. JC047 TaxID=2683199 RepID=UPI0013D0509E|nr:hypothetical protein [Pseudodesulfovibrio sp. JC047]NDV20992.1 hypothetical protein [Pseudodesulfovibrio sp. JC047]
MGHSFWELPPPESVKFEITICASQKASRRKGETFEIMLKDSPSRSAQHPIKTKKLGLFFPLLFILQSKGTPLYPFSGPLLEANPPTPSKDCVFCVDKSHELSNFIRELWNKQKGKTL